MPRPYFDLERSDERDDTSLWGIAAAIGLFLLAIAFIVAPSIHH